MRPPVARSASTRGRGRRDAVVVGQEALRSVDERVADAAVDLAAGLQERADVELEQARAVLGVDVVEDRGGEDRQQRAVLAGARAGRQAGDRAAVVARRSRSRSPPGACPSCADATGAGCPRPRARPRRRRRPRSGGARSARRRRSGRSGAADGCVRPPRAPAGPCRTLRRSPRGGRGRDRSGSVPRIPASVAVRRRRRSGRSSPGGTSPRWIVPKRLRISSSSMP